MGVRILEGTYDGTERAAVMVDSTNDWPVGPLWKGPEAVEQIEAFQDWMRREPWLDEAKRAEIGLGWDDMPNALYLSNDARSWPPSGINRLIAYWRETFLVDGYLPAPPAPVEG